MSSRQARIEQTSRPAEMKGKPVSREVCAVITKGTKTHSVLEGKLVRISDVLKPSYVGVAASVENFSQIIYENNHFGDGIFSNPDF